MARMVRKTVKSRTIRINHLNHLKNKRSDGVTEWKNEMEKNEGKKE